MRIGVLGTGNVGTTIGSKLVELGHDVKMGSRNVANAKAAEWAKANGEHATYGTFSDAAAFGEIIFNCTNGANTLQALEMAQAANLKGKILIDLSNPLDFSKGMPPTLTVCNTDSMGEQIQRAYPDTRVVKTLNTVNTSVMVTPRQTPGDHVVFVGGNDSGAKVKVKEILTDWFGWQSVIDLGDITSARAVEMYLPLWLRLRGALQTPQFNIEIAK